MEKSSSVGRIPSIHQWHARRPLCAMRGVVLESLIEIPEDPFEYEQIKELLLQYCQRFLPDQINLSSGKKNDIVKKQINTDQIVLNILKKAINNQKIRVLDPFAGGGSIPLELAVAGCEVYATDLNPVSILINKATVEYPFQHHGEQFSKVINAVIYYSNFIEEELKKQIGILFRNPISSDNLIIFYIWAHIFPCSKISCAVEIPLFKSLILDKDRHIALLLKKNSEKSIEFEIGWSENPKELEGFYKKGAVTCPKCGTTIPKSQVHEYFHQNNLEDRLIAVYEQTPKKDRIFRIATEEDKKIALEEKNFLPPISPNIELPKRVWKWVIHNFGLYFSRQLLNARQYLVASSYSNLIKNKYPEIVREYGEVSAKAIVLYLQFGLDKTIDYNSRFSMIVKGTSQRNTWTRPGLFIGGCYVESNPFTKLNAGSFTKYASDLKKVFENLSKQPFNGGSVTPIIKQMDARDLEFENEFFDLIITDPPYYDSIPYAADSDFFYVWDRATLADVFPELFINEKTPKDEELVADPNLRKNAANAKIFYEQGMAKSFSEMFRVLKQNGLAIIVFAHKKMAAWETLLQAFIQSKFVLTATWPVPMERINKVGALTTASLTSIILVVARKFARKPETYFDKKFQMNITTEIQNKMQRFWDEGLRGADFFMCAIGPSLTHFSLFERLLNPSTDKPIDVHEYLTFIQTIMVNFAVEQITQSAYSGTLDKITQFYLVWRWGYNLNILPFDEVKILYQALSIDLTDLEKSIIMKKKVKAEYECLSPNERFKSLDSKKLEKFTPESMIDYLQFASYLWEQDERALLESTVNSALLKFGDSFWTIAQALHDVLPECHERTQLQGTLQRFRKFVAREDFKPEGDKTKKVQSTLFPVKKVKKAEKQGKVSKDEEVSEEDEEDEEEINDD